jgi:ribosome-binding protein aMBF1 (putative translation factor)
MSITEQLRQAMDDDGRSRYRLAQEIGVHKSTLHRFYWGIGGLSVGSVERLVDVLGLELRRKRPAGKASKPRKAKQKGE